MEQGIATIVIEPRSLVRGALASLMANHSYRVIGSYASTADLEAVSLAVEAPRLVILGALPADEAAIVAGGIRKRWPDSKVLLVFDQASSADIQKLLLSELDGCIPLFASPDTLVGALQQIIAGDIRIMMVKAETSSKPRPTGLPTQKQDDVSLPSQEILASDNVGIDAVDRTNSVRLIHGLSPREEEILKSVVRGHSNKMIARTCGVTDATVKVHMKSILRKIRVANRTQAAIWALEQGLGNYAGNNSPVLRPVEALAA